MLRNTDRNGRYHNNPRRLSAVNNRSTRRDSSRRSQKQETNTKPEAAITNLQGTVFSIDKEKVLVNHSGVTYTIPQKPSDFDYSMLLQYLKPKSRVTVARLYNETFVSLQFQSLDEMMQSIFGNEMPHSDQLKNLPQRSGTLTVNIRAYKGPYGTPKFLVTYS